MFRPLRLAGVALILLAAGLGLSGVLARHGGAPSFRAAAHPVVRPAPPSPVARDDAPLPPARAVLETRVSPGDTLIETLIRAGAPVGEARAAVAALSDEFDPRRIRPEHSVRVEIEAAPPDGAPRLSALRLGLDPIRHVAVRRAGGASAAYDARTGEDPVTTRPARAEGVITTSLYEAAMDQGVPPAVLQRMIDLYSFDVDFQREIRRGDSFAIMYEERRAADGSRVDGGAILMAEMTLRGRAMRYYRFTDPDGVTDFYDGRGRSVRRALLKTPIDGARISSRFGKRRHPILGYTRQHAGVDFAAASGTPIYAAGGGVVEVAGWNGGYGRYVRIRHGGAYSTAYAHMSRIAKGVAPGARVSQKQVIGYVGSSGQSTGPHLHYEVHKNGRKVNPMSLDLPVGRVLEGAALAAFRDVAGSREALYATLAPPPAATASAAPAPVPKG